MRIITNNYIIDSVELLGIVYAVKAKKKNQSPNGAGLSADAVPLIKGSSDISIAVFFGIVKCYFAGDYFCGKWAVY